MMPEVEGAHAHRKLHSIDVIERRRVREKIERKCDYKKEHGFNEGMLARIAMFDSG